MHPPPLQLQLVQLLKSQLPPKQPQPIVQLLMSQLPGRQLLAESAPLKSQPFGSRQKHKEVQLAQVNTGSCAMTAAGPRKSNERKEIRMVSEECCVELKEATKDSKEISQTQNEKVIASHKMSMADPYQSSVSDGSRTTSEQEDTSQFASLMMYSCHEIMYSS